MSAPRPGPGRPMDADLSRRYVAAAVELIVERGLHRLNSDVLAHRISAGKAGFYRRWTDIDHFLVDVARALAAEPVPYPQPRTAVTDLVALVLHQTAGNRGLVLAELLTRVPHNPALREAWLSTGGPWWAVFNAIADVTAQLGIAGSPAATRLLVGVDRLIADQRERRLLRNDGFVPPAIVEDHVHELLADVAWRTEDPDACARCGCTDEEACPDGCFWVAPRLCSTCATPTELEAHAAEPIAITLVEP